MKLRVFLLVALAASGLFSQSPTWQWRDDPLLFDPSGLDLRNVGSLRYWDWDRDGDLDVFLRRGSGIFENKLQYYQNTGERTLPRWRRVENFFSSIPPSDLAKTGGLALADLLNEGMPLVISNRLRGERISLIAWRYVPMTEASWQTDTTTFSGIDWPRNENVLNPTFADVDRDGDFDCFLGHGGRFSSYYFRFFKNIGSISEPVWQADSAMAARIHQTLISGNDGWWAPEFIDANGDEWSDLVIGTHSGDWASISLMTSAPDGANLKWQFWGAPLQEIQMPLGSVAQIQTIDVDGDDLQDLVLNGKRIYLNAGTSSQALYSGKFVQIGGMPASSEPLLYDYRNDGSVELIMGEPRFEAIRYYYYSFERVELLGMPVWRNSQWLGITGGADGVLRNSLIDLRGDGTLHFVSWGSGSDIANTQIYSWKNVAESGGFQWEPAPEPFEYFRREDFFYFPAFGNLDSDQDQDLLVWKDGYQFYENAQADTGQFWARRTDWENGAEPFLNELMSGTLVDLDRDGDLDLVSGTFSDSLLCLTNVGSSRIPIWQINADIFDGVSVGNSAVPAFADMEGDGRLDLVVRGVDGWLHYFRNESSLAVESRKHESLPIEFELHQNFPNPFTTETKISYRVQRQSTVQLMIHDLLGRRLETLVNEEQVPGNYSVKWNGKVNGKRLPSGLYFYRLQFEGEWQQRKLLLVD